MWSFLLSLIHTCFCSPDPIMSGMPGANEESLLKKCTTKKQFEAMVKFIEDPNNFAIIEGVRTGAMIGPPTGEKALKKINGLEKMAEAVNHKCPGSGWTKEACKNWWTVFKKKYKDTHTATQRTGWGLSEIDTANR